MVTPRNGTGGQVKEIFVKKGDMVKKGQLFLNWMMCCCSNSWQLPNNNSHLQKIYTNRRKNLWAQQIGSEVELVTAKNQVDQAQSRWIW